MVSLHRVSVQEGVMPMLPEQISEWGFSADDISLLERVSGERAHYLSLTDAKGRALSRIVEDYCTLTAAGLDFTSRAVRIGYPDEIDDGIRDRLRESLLAMQPWRKGPFEVFGIGIDSEWRSDLKWDRVINSIRPLAKRHILDIGSSNGYYMFRMIEHNPTMVMGIEPYTNFYYQFMMLNSIAGINNIFTLPLRFEDITGVRKKFNTIFCMGILYHRKSPSEFLEKIRSMLAGDGELVLETLIIEGDTDTALVPAERYAKMPNVYFIPTVNVLVTWLKQAGFRDIRCVDIAPTTDEEQRRTEWIRTETLSDFLDPLDRTKTVEGYPAPVRAVLVAEK